MGQRGGGNVPNPGRALLSPSRAPSAAPSHPVPHTLRPGGMSLWTRATGPRAPARHRCQPKLLGLSQAPGVLHEMGKRNRVATMAV